MKYFGGIDPGEKGAFALRNDTNRDVELYDFKDSKGFERLRTLGYEAHNGVMVVIEKQEPRPPVTPHAAFTMGRYYEAWIARLIMYQIPRDEEVPTTWQKVVFDAGTRPKKKRFVLPPGVAATEEIRIKKLKMRASGEHKKRLKEASVERAKSLYPHVVHLITRHDRAEALLIAHYCYLKYGLGHHHKSIKKNEKGDFASAFFNVRR
jgi:hypothetical protein